MMKSVKWSVTFKRVVQLEGRKERESKSKILLFLVASLERIAVISQVLKNDIDFTNTDFRSSFRAACMLSVRES
jgi:hypothetical protein